MEKTSNVKAINSEKTKIGSWLDNRYFVMDSNGNFSEGIFITNEDNIFTNETNCGWRWVYKARVSSMGYTLKSVCEEKIRLLNELNEVAKFDITWSIYYGSVSDFPCRVAGNSWFEKMCSHFVFVNKDIEPRCIGKHKKLIGDIKKSYRKGIQMLEKQSYYAV